MPASNRSGRFRADLIDVGWAPEDVYGVTPTGGANILGGTDASAAATTALHRQWGLVNGGINLPNPTFAWTPFYGVGVDDRNMLFPIQGQETLEGGMPGAMLCHDSSRLPFEQMYGLAFNAKNRLTGGPPMESVTPGLIHSSGAISGVSGGWTTGGTVISATQATLTGANVGTYKAASSSGQCDNILLIGDAGGNPNPWSCTWAYIGNGGSDNAQINVFKDRTQQVAGWNGKRPSAGASTKYAVCSVLRSDGASDSTSGVLEGAGADIKIVYVRPTLVQESFTLGAKFRGDGGGSFVTNYLGCKVSRFTISLEEGSPVTFNYDFIAQDMKHNIGEDAINAGDASDTARYAAIGTNATSTRDVTPMRLSRVVEQPYFFTGAYVAFHGTPFARLRSLTINVDNALDPRYYITQNAGDSATLHDRQILYEILEGRRTITLSGSVDLDDTGATGNSGGTGSTGRPTDAKFLQYVLNQAFVDADQRDMQTLSGISVVVELRKITDSSDAGKTHSKIILTLPDPGKLNAVAMDIGSGNLGTEGGSAAGADGVGSYGVGLFLNSAGIGVPAPPSIHVPQDFDGQASSLAIMFLDNVGA